MPSRWRGNVDHALPREVRLVAPGRPVRSGRGLVRDDVPKLGAVAAPVVRSGHEAGRHLRYHHPVGAHVGTRVVHEAVAQGEERAVAAQGERHLMHLLPGVVVGEVLLAVLRPLDRPGKARRRRAFGAQWSGKLPISQVGVDLDDDIGDDIAGGRLLYAFRQGKAVAPSAAQHSQPRNAWQSQSHTRPPDL